MQKKIGSTLLVLVLLFTLTGCKSKDTSAINEEDPPINVTLAMVSPTGTMSMVMSAVAECVHKSYPDSVVSLIPGSTSGNMVRVNNHEVDGGTAQAILAYAAYNGLDPYDKKLDNIASVASLFEGAMQLVVAKDLGITTFDEIIANKMKIRITIDQPGNMCQILFIRLLAEYGLTIDDFEAWGGKVLYFNMNDACDMLADGVIDAALISTFVPTPAIQETSINKDLVMLTFKPDIIDSLCEKYGYFETTVPAKTYNFVTEDQVTFGSRTILIVAKDRSDNFPYKLAKSLNENLDYLRAVHSSMADHKSETLVSNLGIPLHPGAEKYYREQGIIK